MEQKRENVKVVWDSGKSTRLGHQYENLILNCIRSTHTDNVRYDVKLKMEIEGNDYCIDNLPLDEVSKLFAKIKKC